MISLKRVAALATTTLAGAMLAASFQAPAFAHNDPERYKPYRHAQPIAGYEIVESTFALRPNAFAGGSARCPAGKRVLGGGYAWPSVGLGSEPIVTVNRPIANGTVWQLTVRNPADSAVTSAIVYAQCAFAR
ncbi:hypothetical protein SAMN05421874_104262 [Nonomuraea maritima]|uniref:Uncharacterized protein n=1 Tax=Nonomuraea maritima TaxID=683260 RepID=A0A1G8Y400_9ACTN|nr:hypothetical protein [Nonomuraea maritima]SDJ97511.1 hypothetical protein SAMN05421874_104262 [Nonomuraea maritima]